MGGQISQEDINTDLVDVADLIEKEKNFKQPDTILDQFVLNDQKEQITTLKVSRIYQIGAQTTSQIHVNNQSKKSIIDDLKQIKSEEIVDHQEVKQPSGSIIAPQDQIQQQQEQQNKQSIIKSKIIVKHPNQLDDADFVIEKHYPVWAQELINTYGKYDCPLEPDYQESQQVILKYEDENYYQGQIQQNNRHGYGILIQEQEVYEGYFENNIRSGWGRLLKKDHLIQGYWKNNVIVRDLEIRKQDEYYKGECSEGIPHGKGRQDNKSYTYEGYFQKGIKHGRGLLIFKEKNDRYDGQFKNDKMNGTGRYYFSNNVTFEGNFKDGQITGKGEMKYPNGRFYRGEFLNGKMHGQGILQNEEGGIHEGQFKDGRKHGFGKTIQAGMEITGEWQNDVLIEEDQDE